MKLDLTPARASYVAPTFGGDDRLPIDPALQRRMRRPMVAGALIIGVLVIGLGAWASFSSLAQGITAPGQVRIESNKKTIRRKEAGTVRDVLVREGQLVRAGQPLILYNDVEARAANDVYQHQVDDFLSQSARFQAEAVGAKSVRFSPELMARASDPQVAGLIRDQEFLFTTRLQLFESQNSVLQQRLDQIETQIQGQQSQVDSVEEQRRLTEEEMAGYQTLYDKGFAPKPVILRYQRSVADLAGRKGSLLADIAKLKQQIGETRMQLAAQRDGRQSQAAEGLRDAQSRLADAIPRLTSVRAGLEGSVVRSPVDGYVFGLSQFTVGGVTGPGETLMEIVPANAPIIVSVMIRPEDVDDVHIGMDARVRFSGLNQRWHSPLAAKVVLVSADRITNDKTGAASYRVDLRIDPRELTTLERNTHITPGMPAQAMLVTGNRSVMSSLISPIVDTVHDALRDQ